MRGSTHQGGAGDLKALVGSELLGVAREGGAESLKGANGDEVEELHGIGRGGGSGRQGGTIREHRRLGAGRRNRLKVGWDQWRRKDFRQDWDIQTAGWDWQRWKAAHGRIQGWKLDRCHSNQLATPGSPTPPKLPLGWTCLVRLGSRLGLQGGQCL